MKRRISHAVALRLIRIVCLVTHSMVAPHLPWLDLEVVEVDHRVGLGPDADLARLRERLVGGLEHFLAVEGDHEAIALGLDLVVVPDPGLDLAAPALDLLALAVLDVVEPD